MVPLIFALGALLGVLAGGALCIYHIRAAILDDIGPKLRRMHADIDPQLRRLGLFTAGRGARRRIPRA